MFTHKLPFVLVLALIFSALTTFATTTTTTTTTTIVVPPQATDSPIPASQCSPESLRCCNALDRSNGSIVGLLLAVVGVVLQGAECLVGIHCVPIDILGLGQNECQFEPVCCENDDFDGLIAIECVPINISL